MGINTFSSKLARKLMKITEKPSLKASKMKFGMTTHKSSDSQEKKSSKESRIARESTR